MAVIGGSLAYLLCDFGQWPLLMYEPYERQWFVATEAPTPATMLYLGMLLWGVGGAIVSAAISVLVCSRLKPALADSTLQLMGGWALTSCGICGLYYLWGLWPF